MLDVRTGAENSIPTPLRHVRPFVARRSPHSLSFGHHRGTVGGVSTRQLALPAMGRTGAKAAVAVATEDTKIGCARDFSRECDRRHARTGPFPRRRRKVL
jgi:hypothetical protein